MEQFNDAPILDQTKDMRDKLLMIALWLVNGDKIVTIGAKEIAAFNAAHDSEAFLFLHGRAEAVDIGVITRGRAEVLAEHQAANTSKASH